MQILPAIIPDSFNHLHDEVAKVKDVVSMVQVDITDGQFVKNKTWPYRGDVGEFEGLLREDMGLPFWEDIDYEFHLMIESPEKTIGNWITLGASSIVVQVETITSETMQVIVEMCKASEVLLGLSIKPSTDNEKVVPYIQQVDFLQCMGSDKLGSHGEKLDESIFEKISYFRGLYPDLPIAVDIGVNRETAADLISAGATKLIIGGAIFNEGNVAQNVEFFESL